MKNSPVQSHVLRLAHPPIPTVHIGIIGLGNRGLLTLQRYLQIEGVEIKALCEIREGNLSKAQQLLKEADRSEATGYTGVEGWKKMCESDEVDLIFICTDWLMHTPMATFAMECNKHVAIEVPAAMSVEECWQLVDTAEKTRRHCITLKIDDDVDFSLKDLKLEQNLYNVSFFHRSYVGLDAGKRFGLFNETALTFNFGKSKFDRGVEENLVNTQTDIFEVQLGINPGLAVFIMQNVSIECSLGIAGIRYRQEKQKNNLGETGKRMTGGSNFRVNPFNISLGLTICL